MTAHHSIGKKHGQRSSGQSGRVKKWRAARDHRKKKRMVDKKKKENIRVDRRIGRWQGFVKRSVTQLVIQEYTDLIMTLLH